MSEVKQYLQGNNFGNFDTLLQLVTMYYPDQSQQLMQYLTDTVLRNICDNIGVITIEKLKKELFKYMRSRFYSSKYLKRQRSHTLNATHKDWFENILTGNVGASTSSGTATKSGGAQKQSGGSAQKMTAAVSDTPMLDFGDELLSLEHLDNPRLFQRDALWFFERVQVDKSFIRFKNIILDELESDMRQLSFPHTDEIQHNVRETFGRVISTRRITMVQFLSVACTGTRSLFKWRDLGWSIAPTHLFEGFRRTSAVDGKKLDAIFENDFPNTVLAGATLMVEVNSNRLGKKYFRYTLGASAILDYSEVKARGERENDRGFKDALISKNVDLWELSMGGSSHKIVDIVTDKPVLSSSRNPAMSAGNPAMSATKSPAMSSRNPAISPPTSPTKSPTKSPAVPVIPANRTSFISAIGTLKTRGWVAFGNEWSLRKPYKIATHTGHDVRFKKVWAAYQSDMDALKGCVFIIKWKSGNYLCKVVRYARSASRIITCTYQDGETYDYLMESNPNNGGMALFARRVGTKTPSEVLDVVLSDAVKRISVGAAATSTMSTTSTTAPIVTKWEYIDNDGRTYKPYDDDQNKEISKVASGADFPKDVVVVDSLKTFGIKKIRLVNKDTGEQIGNYNTRTIRRVGYTGASGTVRPNSSGGASAPSTSTSSMTSGGSTIGSSMASSDDYAQLCDAAIHQFRQTGVPDRLASALASSVSAGAPVTGAWEWSPPFEMTHNRPERFSAKQLKIYGTLKYLNARWKDPLELWEYSDIHADADGEPFYNAMYHCRRWSSSNDNPKPSYFAGFFRFSGGRGPGLYFNVDGDMLRAGDDNVGVVGHLLRQANQYAKRPQIDAASVRTNVVYHAAPRDILAKACRDTLRGSYNQTAMHGRGTYFAMGPFVDYSMGNSQSRADYSTWGGTDGTGFVYILVCHAVTRPSLNTRNNTGKFNNGFNGGNEQRFISAGTCGGQHDLLNNKAQREVIYGDNNVEKVVFPIGIAVFKHS